jgi:hypothetical protein
MCKCSRRELHKPQMVHCCCPPLPFLAAVAKHYSKWRHAEQGMTCSKQLARTKPGASGSEINQGSIGAVVCSGSYVTTAVLAAGWASQHNNRIIVHNEKQQCCSMQRQL